MELVRNMSPDFDAFLEITSSRYFSEFKSFSLADKKFIENELFSQISSYIFGCSLSSFLKNKGITPNSVAGNSMGLYAALFCSGAISFEDGLRLVQKAYELIQKETKGQKMGMGAIVGLDLKDVTKIVDQSNNKAFIANTNGIYSFLISGEKSSVENALSLAKKEGALFISSVLVDSPYHTYFIKSAATEFGKFIDQDIALNDPQMGIISSVDQRTLITTSEIRNELVKNIYHPINWYASMIEMISTGTNCFVECGAGNTLSKLARFINGDFKVYPINKINKLIG